MKKVIAPVTAFLVCVGIWLGWEFQPWMPAGQSIHLSTVNLGGYDFQVWQRKNRTRTEPFATWLFARKQDGKWMPYLLDFEDTYRPSVVLREEGSKVAVFRGNDRLGVFDGEHKVFIRYPDRTVFPVAEIDSEPPGN